MTWNGDEYLEEVNRVIGERVEQAGVSLAETIRTNIGIQGTEQDRSKPGEFPRRQTGNTQGSVEANYYGEEMTTYVGSSWDVARFLELREWQGQRPFLVRTLNEESASIVQSILGSEFTGAT